MSLSDADLHGLLDGHLDASRRGDVLKRLASAPRDLARLEAWQEQTDLLRAAFTGVEREPIPAALDLSPRAKLHCVPDAPIVRLDTGAPRKRTRSRPIAWMAGLAVAVGLSLGCWYVMQTWVPREIGIADPRGSVDDTLRARTASALADTTGTVLPTATIPDLGAAGFMLVGAESRISEPASLVFRYRNAAAERIVISIARTSSARARPPAPGGDVILWRGGTNTFAIAGTIKAERLHAIAVALQADGAE